MSTGAYIKQARIRARLTQDELAELAQIGRSHLARIEGGTIEPGLGWLLKVARALAVEVEVLTGEAPMPIEIGTPSSPEPMTAPVPAPSVADADAERLYARLIRLTLNFDAEQLQAILHYAHYIEEHPPSIAPSRGPLK